MTWGYLLVLIPTDQPMAAALWGAVGSSAVPRCEGDDEEMKKGTRRPRSLGLPPVSFLVGRVAKSHPFGP